MGNTCRHSNAWPRRWGKYDLPNHCIYLQVDTPSHTRRLECLWVVSFRLRPICKDWKCHRNQFYRNPWLLNLTVCDGKGKKIPIPVENCMLRMITNKCLAKFNRDPFGSFFYIRNDTNSLSPMCFHFVHKTTDGAYKECRKSHLTLHALTTEMPYYKRY